MALADIQRKLDSVRTQIEMTLDVLTPETQEEGRATTVAHALRLL